MTITDDLVRKAQTARDALKGLYFSAEEGSPLEAGALAGAEAITGLLEQGPITPLSGGVEDLSRAATQGRFMVEASPDGDALWVGPARDDGVKLRHIVYGVNGLLGYRAEYAAQVRADADYIAALINAHRSGQKLGPMTADEILGVARKAAARAFIENGHEEIAERVLAGQHDDYSNVKCSIDAINILLAEQPPTLDGVIKERDGRRPDGPGLSHSVSSPPVSTAAAASIPGAQFLPWPSDCFKPSACSRHGECVYGLGRACRHHGYDLSADIARARDQRAEREDGDSRPRPEAASPVRNAEAPASTVQPPSSLESGVGEINGWVLVPRQPTQEMICAGGHACQSYCDLTMNAAADAYRAMLSAAPRPSQREG